MPHFLTVRATVADASKRKAFDEWYSKEHLPDAAKTFGAEKAWRFWSVTDPCAASGDLSVCRSRLARAGDGEATR